MDKKSKQTNNINNVLIVALIIAAIVIGYLLGKSGTSSTTTQTANDQQQQEEQTGTPLVDIAAKFGVNKDKFNSCLADEKVKNVVQASLDAAMKAGVPGTPTTVIYELKSARSLVVFNALPYEGSGGYKELIDTFINNTSPQPTSHPGVTASKPSPEKDIWVGDKNAKYVVIVFDDLQCPACRAFHPTLNAIKEQRKDVAIVYRYFPLIQIHPKAFALSQGAECVKSQKGLDAMWNYVDEVFSVGAEAIKIN